MARTSKPQPPEVALGPGGRVQNETWTVDLRNWWRTSDGQRCDCLVIRDRGSGYIICLRPIVRHRTEDMRQLFSELFQEYGLPSVIQVAGGPLFWSRSAPHGLTRINAWWRTLGIRTEPAEVEPGPAREWLPRPIARKALTRQPGTIVEETAHLERWRGGYNERAVFDGLSLKTAALLYLPSARRPADSRPYSYPDWYARRRVRRDGCVLVFSRYLYVSEALSGMEVGLEPLDASSWRVWFQDLPVRELDAKRGVSRRPPVPLDPGGSRPTGRRGRPRAA